MQESEFSSNYDNKKNKQNTLTYEIKKKITLF